MPKSKKKSSKMTKSKPVKQKAKEEAPPEVQEQQESADIQDIIDIQMSGADYDVMMSLLSFGLRTLSAIIKEENDKGNFEVSKKYDATLKKYVDIFHKLEDVTDDNLSKDRVLH